MSVQNEYDSVVNLLCKWCSTFVGKGKKFCSIFCESRYTRSKRRKLAFKRPVQSSGPGEREYESPRTNKTAPRTRKEFLEDVITAMDGDKSPSDKDKRLADGNTSGTSNDAGTGQTSQKSNDKSPKSGGSVPKLDLTSPKENKAEVERSKSGTRKTDVASKTVMRSNEKSKTDIKTNPKDKTGHKTKALNGNLTEKSKTQTLLVHATDSKIPVTTKASFNKSADDIKSQPDEKRLNSADKMRNDLKTRKLTNLNDRLKLVTSTKSVTNLDIIEEASERQKSKFAQEYEKKVRSSGYGNPVNPKLRPMALKPRSATVGTTPRKETAEERQISARSSKSSAEKAFVSLKKEDARPIISGRKEAKWELIATNNTNGTTEKESEGTTNGDANTSLEDEDPTVKSSHRAADMSYSSRTGLTKISEIVREESSSSDLPGRTELEIRLSSIKRKVEVRKRGRDSRSSFGSDLDTSFQDSSLDISTDRDIVNRNRTARNSARSNITKISKQFRNEKTPVLG
ncbi:uncharacterized protein LOC127835558 [Dreissena polymorpha]|uniref:uncharacterized protein LOC127835558 n=1 Tax=Dreissena polymorpha TaxID=45954 RepID=UPI002265125C|nr:uncharacterized protein LOC127835558 [Dreissena polymorpha]